MDMALSEQDRQFVETVAELSAERAATKAVDKMASIMGDMLNRHTENCEARDVWRRVRGWLVLGALGVGGAGVGITELIRHLSKSG